MLLDNNTESVMDLVEMVDDLNIIDKIRLSIHILEDLGFISTYNVNNFIKVLKEVLELLDSNSTKVITNFAKYKNLLFISAKYMELSARKLANLLNLSHTEINNKINKKLNVYDYCYSFIIL